MYKSRGIILVTGSILRNSTKFGSFIIISAVVESDPKKEDQSMVLSEISERVHGDLFLESFLIE